MLVLLFLFACFDPIQAQPFKFSTSETGTAKTVTASSTTSCTQTSPCDSGSINLAWDSAGTACPSGPGMWGNCASVRFPLTFQGVPSGQKIVVTRFYGDVIGWASTAVTPGHHAGILWGAWNSNTPSNTVDDGSTLVANSSCSWYDQGSVSSGDFTVLFDRPNLNWPLAGDNMLTVQLAEFLNNTGASIHVELTFNLQYYYQ